MGLDQADKIASVVGALATVIALVVAVRQARGQHGVVSGPGSGARPALWLAGGLAMAVCCASASWALVSAASKMTDRGSGDDLSGGPAAARSTGATAPTKPPAAPVLWTGEVRLDGTPRDFDFEPPARGNTSSDLSSDGYLNGSVYSRFWGRAVVLWVAKADPSRADCATRLQTHGVKEVTIKTRSRICLETGKGRIVLLKVLRRDGEGYDAQATIWGAS